MALFKCKNCKSSFPMHETECAYCCYKRSQLGLVLIVGFALVMLIILFCDKSHLGTLFKPIKFTIEEVKEKMDICGCKLSKEAPFCDKITCKKILE